MRIVKQIVFAATVAIMLSPMFSLAVLAGEITTTANPP